MGVETFRGRNIFRRSIIKKQAAKRVKSYVGRNFLSGPQPFTMIREIVTQRMLNRRSSEDLRKKLGRGQGGYRENPRKSQGRPTEGPGKGSPWERPREGRSQAGRESGLEEAQEKSRADPVAVQEGPRECLGKDPKASREGRPGKSRELVWITAIEGWGISRNSCMKVRVQYSFFHVLCTAGSPRGRSTYM